jgi:hypothetical protein
LADNHGLDGLAIGDKLDKSLNLRYIRDNIQICKSLWPSAENRLSRLLMTLQQAAMVYVYVTKSKMFEGRPVTRRFPMKLISSPACAGGQMANRGRIVFGIGCLLAALFSIGCHKAADATAVPPPAPVAAPDTNQNSQPAAATPDTIQNPNPASAIADPTAVSPANPNSVPMAKPNGQPDLTALDTALMGWLVANRRVPNSFAEFAATAGVAIPRPPPGKKYVITPRMHVQLVNQ